VPSPLVSEENAFRLVLLTLGYLGLIAVGAAINTWLGLAVFLVETAAIVVWIVRRRRDRARGPAS
jgi:hypothetical protein